MQSLRRFASPRPSEGVAVIVRPQALARLPRAGGPQLSNAAGQLLRQIRVSDEYGDEHAIQVPVERPLSVLVDGRPVATLWTLGACPEWLVLGYLWHQQLVTDVTRLKSIPVDWQTSTAQVHSLRPCGARSLHRLRRRRALRRASQWFPLKYSASRDNRRRVHRKSR